MAQGPKKRRKRIVVNARMQQFLDGTLKVEDLDDEEIRRGQFRNKNGEFTGRQTEMIPRQFYDAVVRENIRRANKKFQEELQPAIDVLKMIATNPRAPADARMKSAIYLIERSAGKVPEKSEIKLEVAKWEKEIEGLVYEGDEEASE